jgi:hypothetical protein
MLERSLKEKIFIVNENAVTGLIYGIWSVIIQNTIGEGGPVVIVCAIIVFILPVVVKMEGKRLLKDFGN